MISSIGVALAMVREVVERVIPNPTPEDLQAHQARGLRGRGQLGAAPRTSKSRSRSTRRPSGCAPPRWVPRRCARASARTRSERPRRAKSPPSRWASVPERVALAAATDQHARVPGRGRGAKWRFFTSAAARCGRSIAKASSACSAATAWFGRSRRGPALDGLRRLWEDVTIYNGDSVITPDVFVIVGGQLVDLSGVNSIDQAMAIDRSELEGLAADASIALIGIPPSRGL